MTAKRKEIAFWLIETDGWTVRVGPDQLRDYFEEHHGRGPHRVTPIFAGDEQESGSFIRYVPRWDDHYAAEGDESGTNWLYFEGQSHTML